MAKNLSPDPINKEELRECLSNRQLQTVNTKKSTKPNKKRDSGEQMDPMDKPVETASTMKHEALP